MELYLPLLHVFMVWCVNFPITRDPNISEEHWLLVSTTTCMKLSESDEVARTGKTYKMSSIKIWRTPSINRALKSSTNRWDLHTARAKTLKNSNNLSHKVNLKGRFEGRCVEWVPLGETRLLWIREWNFGFYIQIAETFLTRAWTVSFVRRLFLSSPSPAPISETLAFNDEDMTIH